MKRLPPIKINWLDRAIQVYNYHVLQCKDEVAWTIERTAKSLCRSVGSVSQDITVAQWVKTHEKQLRKFRNLKDALEWVKSKKQEMNSQEIEI